MSGIKFNAVYKNTTIDPPFTQKHVATNGVINAKPKDNFFNLIDKAGFPNRWARFCCGVLKEYKLCDVSLQGIRIEESKKRAERYKEPNYCRMYSATQKTNVWLPIREWTTEDIREFVNSENIQLHLHYYDDNGRFCPERRLGCIGCPLASKRIRLEQLKRYPLFVRQYVRHIKIHRQWREDKMIEKGEIKTREEAIEKKWGGLWDEYAHTVYFLFCADTSVDAFHLRFGNGFFGRTDCKKLLEDYFQITLP